MKKNILLLALAGSIFVSQPVKPVSTINVVTKSIAGTAGVAGVVMGGFFLKEAFARVWKRIKGEHISAEGYMDIGALSVVGFLFIIGSVGALDYTQQ